MKTVQVFLNSIEKVRRFVNDVSKFENEFDLVAEKYVIDAKSIMGIFSLDLTKPLTLIIHQNDSMELILDKLSLYMI